MALELSLRGINLRKRSCEVPALQHDGAGLWMFQNFSELTDMWVLGAYDRGNVIGLRSEKPQQYFLEMRKAFRTNGVGFWLSGTRFILKSKVLAISRSR